LRVEIGTRRKLAFGTGRCWACIWAALNALPIPARTTREAEATLRGLTYNRAAGRNPPEHCSPREGEVLDDIKRLAEMALKEILFA
jgi:acetoin utilization protein AcuC